jgi:RNA polymerase sigma-70 factor (ECF subfamily)
LLARERLAHVSAVVDNLPNQQRAVFVLRFLEEMSIEEIAQATSLRSGTVKTHLFRAVSAVRERVKERKDQ